MALDCDDLRLLSQMKDLTEFELTNFCVRKPLRLPTEAGEPLVNVKRLHLEVYLPDDADEIEYLALFHLWFPNAEDVEIQVAGRFEVDSDEETDEETDGDSDSDADN